MKPSAIGTISTSLPVIRVERVSVGNNKSAKEDTPPIAPNPEVKLIGYTPSSELVQATDATTALQGWGILSTGIPLVIEPKIRLALLFKICVFHHVFF